MAGKWLQIIRNGGDASVGAAVMRLAMQAVSVHQFEALRGGADEVAAAGNERPAPRIGEGAVAGQVAPEALS